eukprot:jgi/Orpsp1_1/1187783/evm.model.d7180000060147.1
MEKTSLFKIYLERQSKFIFLVKDIQLSLKSKEFKNQETYRYLVCAKVIDQLEEFEIKPAYESVCKSLHNVAKTPVQMKLLWLTILNKTGGRPDCINSTHVNQYWKELCMNNKSFNICNIKNERNGISKIDTSLNKYTKEKMHKQINNKNQNQMNQVGEKIIQNIKQKQVKLTSYPSPILTESSGNNNNNNQLSIINIPIIYSNTNSNNNSICSISPVSDCGFPESRKSINVNNSQFIQYNSNSILFSSNDTVYCVPIQNNSYQCEHSIVPVPYLQSQSQSQSQPQYIYY